jgi:hypothetical protein
MVRTIEGAPKFIVDADECCCQACPLSCDHCGGTYRLVFSGSGDCNSDQTFDMARVAGQCQWTVTHVGTCGTGGFFPWCRAAVDCLYQTWVLSVDENGGKFCRYTKAATYSSCPAGTYAFDMGTCSSCPETVTVTTV